MTRELLILRHGKSAWPELVADYNRPLKKRGRKAAVTMGIWLHEQNLIPDWIISSPADRARETAEKLCKGIEINRHKFLIFDDRIYEASLDDLLAVLADCPSFKRRIVLVGHNPGLDSLLQFLSSQTLELDDEGKILGTTHLAHLHMPEDWQTLEAGCAELKGIFRPRDVSPEEEHEDTSILDQPESESESESESEEHAKESEPPKKHKSSPIKRLQHWIKHLGKD